MKQSPRAWLLARHQSVTPSLDSARRTVLAETLGRHAAENAPVPTSQLLRALFLPNRRLWAALATIWLLLVTFHFTQHPSTPSISSTPQLTANPTADPHTSRLANATSFAARQAQLHALLR